MLLRCNFSPNGERSHNTGRRTDKVLVRGLLESQKNAILPSNFQFVQIFALTKIFTDGHIANALSKAEKLPTEGFAFKALVGRKAIREKLKSG